MSMVASSGCSPEFQLSGSSKWMMQAAFTSSHGITLLLETCKLLLTLQLLNLVIQLGLLGTLCLQERLPQTCVHDCTRKSEILRSGTVHDCT